MALSRRSFLRAAGVAAAGAAAGPLIRMGSASGAPTFKAKRVVVVSIAGGLRLRESLGMAEGATLPNLFGDVPIIPGYGAGSAGKPVIAPEYAASAMMPNLLLPPTRKTPLFTEGALVTNLRYAEGAPGHLQGGACLVSGAYNNIDNRADAHVPAPTLFEMHRRQANTAATDAWYISNVPGFYRALQTSVHPEYGPRFGASWVSPPGVMTPIVPIVAGGMRSLQLKGAETVLPTIVDSADERAAVRRLTAVVDGNSPAYANDGVFRATPAENAAIEGHLGEIFADPTYQSFNPASYGIGVIGADGSYNPTGDVASMYHTEQILKKFKPTVTVVSLIDIDACHDDFNAYLLGQTVADACVTHLWDTIQSTDGLRDETALIVLPEHGRQLFFNGKNPDSLDRSGLDHGGGDDGDRDVWMLALGPDFKPGVYEPTGIDQPGRTSGRYETIDAILTAATLLGYGEQMADNLTDLEMRPGLVVEDILGMKTLANILVALSLVAGAGCTQDVDAGGEPVQTADVDDPLDMVVDLPAGSLDAIQKNVFARSCAAQPGLCHSGQFEPNLSTPALAYANLVRRPSLERTKELRVDPGDPGASLLIAKLRNQDVISQMPLGAHPLPEEEIVEIEQWIQNGALRRAGAEPAPVLNNPPAEPQLGVFDAMGTRLDVSGPFMVTPGTALTFRISVDDFETADDAIPYAGFILQVAEGATIEMNPGGGSGAGVGLAAYDPDDPPQGKGDVLNWRYDYIVPETVTLLADTGPTPDVPTAGLSLTVIPLYIDGNPEKQGMVSFAFALDLIQVQP